MSTDKRLETLYAHYNDVVGDRRNRIRYRNRYLFLILVVVALILVQGLHSEFVLNILVGVLTRFAGAELPDDFLVLEPILLFAYMLLVLRYLQMSVGIERSYDDTKYHEEQLRSTFGVPIRFEGEGYEKDYPTILNCFDSLYKLVIPIGLLIVAALPIVQKLQSVLNNPFRLDTFTVVFAAVVIVFVVLYLCFSYSGTLKRVLHKRGLGRDPAAREADEATLAEGR